MSEPLPPWLANVDPRFVRPDWQKWVRPDWQSWMPPGYAAQPAPRSEFERLYKPYRDEPSPPAPRRASGLTEADILFFRSNLAALRFKLALLKWRLKAGFNPNQPRVPAGNPDGGQWTSEGGTSFVIEPNVLADNPGDTEADSEEPEAKPVRVAQLLNSVRDVDGTPYYQPGGHHELPKAVYKDWNLSPETRKVFDHATTGKLGMTFRTTPEGEPQGNFWDGPSGPHGVYNEAVTELSYRYMQEHGITPETMTPEHALELLKDIRDSQDPRIRNYNRSMRFIRRIFRLRIGRGNE